MKINDRTAYWNTIDFLRACIRYRNEAGRPANNYTKNPTWLVNMAVNRRAGWPDNPGLTRGSAKPINGEYPKKAGDDYNSLCLLAKDINTPRLIVRDSQLGKWRKLILSKIPHRIADSDID